LTVCAVGPFGEAADIERGAADTLKVVSGIAGATYGIGSTYGG
jgi:hypothetical protein